MTGRSTCRSTALARALVLALGSHAGLAGAAELPLWELGVGVGVLALPHYRGADQSHTWLLPVPYAVYRGEFLRADRDGARAVLFDSDRVDLDLSLSASAPTRGEDNRAREGMPDLAPTIEIGPRLDLTLARGTQWRLDLRSPVRAVMTVERSPKMLGWTATPHLNLDIGRGNWNVGLQAGPVWSSRRLHGYYYDVADTLATAERAAYRAPGGYGGWQATLAWSRRYADHWTGLFVRVDSVDGAAFGPSPLVRQQQSISLGVAWSWIAWRSERLVHVPDRP